MGIKVFLDMDGVICDFMGRLHKILGISYDPSRYPYEVSKYDIFEDVCARSNGRVSMDNLYSSCDKSEFWSEMEWDRSGKEIIDALSKEVDWNDVCICTSPMANPDAWAGKIRWLRKNLPYVKYITITTAPKHFLSKPGHILIDDKDTNVERWNKQGGKAFLIPQPWNQNRDKFNTNFIPELKDFLKSEREAQELRKNPIRAVLRALGCE